MFEVSLGCLVSVPERERKEIRKKKKIETHVTEVRWIPPLIKEESNIHIPIAFQGTHLLRDV